MDIQDCPYILLPWYVFGRNKPFNLPYSASIEMRSNLHLCSVEINKQSTQGGAATT